MGGVSGLDLDFKSQFYNLQGIHINERKKNLSKLLNATSPDIPDDQIDIYPRNYQESIFYVDVLIHFKKVEKLIDILKEGIGALVSKILKQHWFFEEAFKNMSEEDIVETFLPTLSYSLRMKVLKKLSLTLSEERMNKIYDLVLERYGLFIAKQFLFSCSRKKTILILENNEITLSSGQLKRLLKKDIDLVKVYIQEYKKNKRTNFDDYKFLNYLAWKHPNLYFDLGLNKESSIKLGRYTTRAVIKTNKEDVLKDIKNSSLNKGALVRQVSEFNKEYLFMFFPRDMKDINDDGYSSNLELLVSKYPIKKRWNILSYAFKRAYNIEIIEQLDKFEEKLAKFFPKKIQQKWAEMKYLASDKIKYMKYFDPIKAFKLLKDKINITPNIRHRGKLLVELITVCYTNKDYSTYEDVLKYICTRHRNEDINVRSNLINHIKRHIDYNLITEVHWKYINELINIIRIKDETLPFDLITEFLLFVYKRKLSLDGPVSQHVKDRLKNENTFRLSYLDQLKEPEAESTILKHIVKILPTIEHKNRDKATYEIMSNIIDFNKEIKNEKRFSKEFDKIWIDLNDCTLIMDLIKRTCTKQEPDVTNDFEIVSSVILYNCLYSNTPLKGIDEKHLLDIVKTLMFNGCTFMMNYSILEIIKKPNRNDFENILLDYFFDSANDGYYFMKEDAINYFLVKEPEIVAKYFNTILHLGVISGNEVIDYGIIKKYSHLGLAEKMIARFKAFDSVNTELYLKTALLSAMSKVINTKDFLDLVRDYTPEAKKLNLDIEAQKELYLVQCSVAKAFKNLDEVSILAPVLVNFCQGDYLQSSLAALYRVLYRINEEQAFSYINVLSVGAVSVKKHAVFMGFELLSRKDALGVYSELTNKENNISAKKYLFDAALKYFIKNPLETMLDIVLLNMDFVDKNDTEMIQTLLGSVNKITNKYKPLFIEKVWHFLDILELQVAKAAAFRNTLLQNINSYETSFILRFNKNFCEDIIQNYFLACDVSLQKESDEIDYFVINYLLAHLDEEHFKFVFDIIKIYKDKHWESDDIDTVPYIFRFFADAYEKFYNNDVKFLNLFTTFWEHLFNCVESFSQYVMLRLMALYKENINIEPFSQEANKSFEEVLSKYGPYISELLIMSTKTFFSNIPTKHKTNFNLENFIFYLLQFNSNEFNCFFAFTIIKDFPGTDRKEEKAKVVDALKAVDILTAKIYCNVLI